MLAWSTDAIYAFLCSVSFLMKLMSDILIGKWRLGFQADRFMERAQVLIIAILSTAHEPCIAYIP